MLGADANPVKLICGFCNIQAAQMMPRLFGSTLTVSVMTLLSRVLGFIRDQVIAILFGAGAATDAFVVAQRIPNMFRRLFAEGAFSQAFVPVIGEYKKEQGEAATRELVDNVAGTLLFWLMLITVLGVLLAPVLIFLIASGFSQNPEQADLAAHMLRLTFPYLLFISLTAFSAGILNTWGKFAVPAFTPALLNLSIIACAVWLAPKLEQPIVALAWGVLLAGVAQLLFQVPALAKIGMLPRFRFNFSHPGVKRIMQLMAPALLGSSAAQINLLINTNLASFLVAGSVSWLYFSDRFVEFPLAIFGVAIATVLLPRLTEQKREKQHFSATLNWGLRLNLVIVLPAMLGLMLLAQPILTTLLQYREFTRFDSQMASYSLITFALGLPAFASIKVLAPGFYSQQDTRTPVRFALIAIACNLLINFSVVLPWILLDKPFGHALLALSAALAAWVNAGLLYTRLRRADHFLPDNQWRRVLIAMPVALIVMGTVLWVLTPPMDAWQARAAGGRALWLVGLIAAGAASYCVGLLCFGVRPSQFRIGAADDPAA